jgi:hypothetical protein
MSFLDSSIKTIRVETRWTPPIVITDPFGGSPKAGPGMGAQIGRWFRPAVTVETALGPIRTAPWGEPGPSQWPVVRTGMMLAIIGLAGVFLLRS